ncbi:MAG TPA: phosphoesterase, partial [Verrucomicrobiae bacterium]|nr:phosphoesterase [Verrucomicrobiae bacterium]
MNPARFLFFVVSLLMGCQTKAADRVGPLSSAGHLTATHQLIRPAGQSVEFGGRPVDLVASPDGRTLYVKDNRGLVVIDAATWRIRQEFKFNGGGGSVHGMAVTRDGSRIYATTPQDILWEITTTPSGKVERGRKLVLPGPGGKGDPVLAGLALSADEKTAYVCLSRNNSLGILDLASGKLVGQVPVGVAPYDVVLVAEGKKAFVSNWGGRHPRQGERTA